MTSGDVRCFPVATGTNAGAWYYCSNLQQNPPFVITFSTATLLIIIRRFTVTLYVGLYRHASEMRANKGFYFCPPNHKSPRLNEYDSMMSPIGSFNFSIR